MWSSIQRGIQNLATTLFFTSVKADSFIHLDTTFIYIIIKMQMQLEPEHEEQRQAEEQGEGINRLRNAPVGQQPQAQNQPQVVRNASIAHQAGGIQQTQQQVVQNPIQQQKFSLWQRTKNWFGQIKQHWLVQEMISVLKKVPLAIAVNTQMMIRMNF
jgi:hypothetical protein